MVANSNVVRGAHDVCVVILVVWLWKHIVSSYWVLTASVPQPLLPLPRLSLSPVCLG